MNEYSGLNISGGIIITSKTGKVLGEVLMSPEYYREASKPVKPQVSYCETPKVNFNADLDDDYW